jgi:hypothetical protein
MGTSYFEFPNITLIPNTNGYAAWTIAAVLRSSSTMQKWTLGGSPTGVAVAGTSQHIGNRGVMLIKLKSFITMMDILSQEHQLQDRVL